MVLQLDAAKNAVRQKVRSADLDLSSKDTIGLGYHNAS